MKVIEKFIQGKFADDVSCEDGIFINENFISVIDGVTSHSKFLYQGKKLGRIICEILLEAFEKLDYTYNAYESIDFFNKYILEYYKKINIFDDIKEDAAKQPSASVIIYSKYYNQIWQIGDSLALYGNTLLENPLEVDNLYIDIRVKTINYLLETGHTVQDLLENDISRAAVVELAKLQPYLRNNVYNSKYDYAVIDGFNTPSKDLIKIVDVPKEIHEIIFASDGYVKIFNTLEESERHLQYVKEIDPLRYKEFPFTKGFYPNQVSYDDRAYIRFEI